MIWQRLQSSFLLVLALGLAGCTTTEAYQTIQLPAFAGALFSECSGKDGSISIEMFSAGKVQQIFDADWTSDPNGDWGVASYSPLGQTLFQMDFSQKDQVFKQTGRTFEELGSLAVGSNHLLSLGGHDIGLRTDEVSCLLNHKIPMRWLKRIVSESDTANEKNYVIADSSRIIKLALNKHGNRSEEYWKATIDWRLYWGLKKLQLTVRLLRDEQALIIRSDQFENIDCRIVSQEE